MIAQSDRTGRKRRRGVRQTTGRIMAIHDGEMNVRTTSGVVRASRAVSCLVAPEVDDLVLVVHRPRSTSYVLAVLERPDEQHIQIAPEGDLTLQLRDGRFTVAAAAGVNLVSQQTVSVVADRVEGRAREASFLGGSMRLIADSVSTTLQRLSQAVKRVYRRVDEIEHVRAGQLDYASEGTLRLHGENALISARRLVKADGEQIHIG